ncbi:iron-sulfur cluster assembly scaffold protein [Legionella dresdenensis]|uniref:Iron-sulfur cluster assembly scaffold protein n=1 Tax=Legionella dresdenensis TaxID=450200 RepID=A0ABV8CD36_9GAMM
MNYNKIVESCFFQPKHIGVLDLSLPFTVTVRAGDPEHGEFFDLYWQSNEAGQIVRTCFKAYGNPYLIAALEWVCRHCEQTSLTGHPSLDYRLLVEKLEIPAQLYAIALKVEKSYKDIVNLMNSRLEKSND